MSIAVPTDPEQTTPQRIPRLAFISGIAALAFTTGITVALIPALRRNAQRSKTSLQFLSNASLTRGAGTRARMKRPTGNTVSGSPITSSTATASTKPTLSPISSSRRPALEILDDPHPSLPPANPAEPDIGPGEGRISPLFALGAFGIATGLVLTTAGLGAWGIAKALDVRNMEEFTAKMRAATTSFLPRLSDALYTPTAPSTPVRIDHELPGATNEEDDVVRGWVGDVLREMESEREVLVRERRR